MKFLKMKFSIELDIAEPVPLNTPVGSILEDMLADENGKKQALEGMQKGLEGLGHITSFNITEAAVVEI